MIYSILINLSVAPGFDVQTDLVIVFDIIIDQLGVGLVQHQYTTALILQYIVVLYYGLGLARYDSIEVLKNLIPSNQGILAVYDVNSFWVAPRNGVFDNIGIATTHTTQSNIRQNIIRDYILLDFGRSWFHHQNPLLH